MAREPESRVWAAIRQAQLLISITAGVCAIVSFFLNPAVSRFLRSSVLLGHKHTNRTEYQDT